MRINTKRLLLSVALPLLVGGLAGLLTRNSMETFAMVKKPPLAPPAWLFPVAWTILYTLMGIASYLVWESDAQPQKKQNAFNVYFYQLIANFLWPVFFFNLGWYLFAFLWLILLWVLVWITFRRFYEISKPAGVILIPYLLWLTFAGYLNWGIWYLNRG